MAQLTFIGMHDDGASLLLRGRDGAEHHLPVCAGLRAAVSAEAEGEGAQPESRTPRGPLRPAEIQSRLRAGATVEELAEATGSNPERIRRFEPAIVTERGYVLARVREHRVDGFDGSATVGELADARLRARGVEPSDATWLARRDPNAPWQIEVRFPAGAEERVARWHYDLRSRRLTALDDEARWLAQPDEPLTADVVAVPMRRNESPLDDTSAILKDLAARRGRRNVDPVQPQTAAGKAASKPEKTNAPKPTAAKATPAKSTAPVTAELDAVDEEPPPITTRAPIVELNPATRAASGNRSAAASRAGASARSATGNRAPTTTRPARKRAKSTRASLPSWDEIVLGPKREDE